MSCSRCAMIREEHIKSTAGAPAWSALDNIRRVLASGLPMFDQLEWIKRHVADAEREKRR